MDKNSKLQDSELILNKDGSIYHLGITPGQLATKIITVGDPERLELISKHFDVIHSRTQRREFHMLTGELQGTAISIVSTGIGTDNIDIVLNEIDALFNVDFETRLIKQKHTQLSFFRLGTSGSIQSDVPVDSIVISATATGLDGLMHFYNYQENETEQAISASLQEVLDLKMTGITASAAPNLISIFETAFPKANTITATGFYGPQGRSIRLKTSINNLITRFSEIRFSNNKFHNLEMETAGIYAMSQLLGHKAIAVNAILANRINQKFSLNPEKTVNKMIESSLELILAS